MSKTTKRLAPKIELGDNGKGGRIACGNGAQIMLGFIKMLGGSQSISNNWQTHTLVTLKLMTSFVLHISIHKYFILLPLLHGSALTFSCINKYENGIQILFQNATKPLHSYTWLSDYLWTYVLNLVLNCWLWSESWVNVASKVLACVAFIRYCQRDGRRSLYMSWHKNV